MEKQKEEQKHLILRKYIPLLKNHYTVHELKKEHLLKEIDYKDLTIEEQQKEINKQRNLKRLGFVGSVVLPILTLILLL